METISVLKSNRVSSNKTFGIHDDRGKKAQERTDFDPAFDCLIAEGNVTFFQYLKSLNLSKESDMLVLPSDHHYYYDEQELKSVRILINLKKLNLIKHLDMFLNTLVQILPPNANFIGCFSDCKTLKETNFPFYRSSRFFGRFINFLDSKTDHIMNKNEVLILLERNGFKTIDMKEMNGLTYFHSKMSDNLYN
jgi:hypothetical protein